MPNIGDMDTVLYKNFSGTVNDLNTQTGNGYLWDFSGEFFLSTIYNVETFRVKTDPISTPYVDATIEHYVNGTSGIGVSLYDYDNDTLLIHRLGAGGTGTPFVPPMASILFPIAFNQTSDITTLIYASGNLTGERRTTVHYDGFGTLQLPNNKNYSNVFRVKKIEEDTNFVTQNITTYVSYIWYKQGGQVPLLRITNSGGTNYYMHASQSANVSTSINEIDDNFVLNVYPNPSKGEVTISSDETINSVELYNIIGEKVIEKKVMNKTTKINMGDFNKGVYVVRILFNQGSKVRKIILD